MALVQSERSGMNWDTTGVRGIICVVLVLTAAIAVADDYETAYAELLAAYQAADYPALVAASERVRDIRPHNPGAYFNMAYAHTLNGTHDGAIDAIDRLLELQRDFNIRERAEFEPLHEDPRWPGIVARVNALYEPIGEAETVAKIDEPQFIPEGIAVDAGGNVFLGSIRFGKLVRVGDAGQALSDRQGHWSVFGMRFDAAGQLWFASAAIPQFAGESGDNGKTGLFRLDPDRGTITRAALLPQYVEKQLLGDLIVLGGAIYATDSLTGAVYRYDIDDDTFEPLLPRGTLGSPQGLVADASGQYLYVADYIGGLYRVGLADGSHTRLRLPADLTDYGIDGLYRHGDRLIAIQNGHPPHRIVALSLTADGLGIEDARILAANLEDFDEPTLGTIVGDELWFVANSQWHRFDAKNRLPDDLTGPIILKLRLGSH